MRKDKISIKFAYLPLVFSSAAILASQAIADSGQNYPEARQVGSANYEYVGGRTQIGGNITDDGDVSVDLNHIFSETDNSSSSVGLWAGVDLDDGDGVEEGGVQLNHNWVSRDKDGQASHVNKVFAAFDRNQDDHEKATIGYGQEREHLFWEGHVSKGLSGKKKTGLKDLNGRDVSSKAYDYGVGASIGTFLKGLNLRIRGGLDHEWGDDVAFDEDDASNTTLSAGLEKFFQGTPHSVSLDVAASRRDGGTELAGIDDEDVRASLGYHYDFGGASIYQADREYRRVRVEIPGQARPAKYAKQPIYKRVATYKNVPVFGKKTVKKPYKQLVKSTMELEGQTFFKLNSASLIPSAKIRLKQIARQINSNGYKGSIRITGNTCGLGNAVYDQRLSEQRANAVRRFLIKQGINADHLIARGLGKGHPKYPNTPSQGFKNRRVDIEYMTETMIHRTAYRSEQKTVQTGTRRVATGFKNVPAGFKNVMIDSGAPGAPRVIWKTVAVKTPPAWIKRALRNNIKHDRNVNTYFTTAGNVQNGTNSAPKAFNDTSRTACNSPVIIKVLENDTDADRDNLSITSISGVSNGQADIVGRTIKYTPDACGITETFNYTISDGKGGTDSASVVVNVDSAPVQNTAPNALDDKVSTKEGKPVTVKVLTNDSDPESDPLSIEGFTQGAHGRVSRGPDNALIYAPNADFSGTDSFKYTISDGNGHTDSATVFVTVNSSNTGNVAPLAADDNETTLEGNPVVVDVINNDFDADDDELKIDSFTQGENGSVTLRGNGSLRYTPESGFTGNDSFKYTITDGNGHTATATVSITVEANQNPDPIVVQNDTATTPEDKGIVIDVLANDSAGLTITSAGTAANGFVEVINGKSISYFPNSGFSGADSFTYNVKDVHGQTAQATVSVTVEAAPGTPNRPPKANEDAPVTNINTPITIDVLANDTDPDEDTLTITNITQPQHGSASIVDNKIVYTPDDTVGSMSLVYTISDGNGHTDQTVLTIAVVDPNDGNDYFPNIQNDEVTIRKDESVLIDVLANDSDLDGDELILDQIDNGANGITEKVNNQIRYTPLPGFVGTDSFFYGVHDGHGHNGSGQVFITVIE